MHHPNWIELRGWAGCIFLKNYRNPIDAPPELDWTSGWAGLGWAGLGPKTLPESHCEENTGPPTGWGNCKNTRKTLWFDQTGAGLLAWAAGLGSGLGLGWAPKRYQRATVKKTLAPDRVGKLQKHTQNPMVWSNRRWAAGLGSGLGWLFFWGVKKPQKRQLWRKRPHQAAEEIRKTYVKPYTLTTGARPRLEGKST